MLVLMMCPEIYSHRMIGFGPENTIAGAKNVKELSSKLYRRTGRRINLEADAGVTKDKVPVLLHDGTLTRTTKRPGKLSELNFIELASYSAGAAYGLQYANEKVAPVDELLGLYAAVDAHDKTGAQDGERLILDIKDEDPTDLVLLNLVRARGMLDRVMFSSEYLNAIMAIKKQEPEAVVGLVTQHFDVAEQVPSLARTGIDYLSPWINTTSPSVLDVCRRRKVQVYPWFGGDQTDWDDAANRMVKDVAPQVQGIITNHPKELAEKFLGPIFAEYE